MKKRTGKGLAVFLVTALVMGLFGVFSATVNAADVDTSTADNPIIFTVKETVTEPVALAGWILTWATSHSVADPGGEHSVTAIEASAGNPVAATVTV